MKSKQLVPILVIFASLVLLCAVLLLAAPPASPAKQNAESRATTFSAGPQGTKALLLVLDHFIPGVRRWMKPMQSLTSPGGSSPSTLLVMQPIVTLKEKEASSLDTWVSRGGQLIIATSVPWQIESDGQTDDYLARHGFKIGAPVQYLRSYTGRGGSLLLDAASLDRSDFEPLFSGPSGAVGAQRHVGSGRIIVITDGSAWSNMRLGESNNAAWLVQIAGTWKNGRLLVDEYHLGNTEGRRTPQLILAFLGTFWGLAFLQVGLAAAIYLLRRARHFGPALDLPRERIQDPLERIRGIGAFLQAAGASEFSTQAITQLAAARRHTRMKERTHE
jgi:hypothetical protein